MGTEYGPDAVRYEKVSESGVIFSGVVERRLFVLRFPQGFCVVFYGARVMGIVLAYTIFWVRSEKAMDWSPSTPPVSVFIRDRDTWERALHERPLVHPGPRPSGQF